MRLFQFLLILVLTATLFSCQNKAEKTVIYLVRHAEKDTTVSHDNPSLINKGIKRAKNLVEQLRNEDIKYIYSTKYIRNINTVQPVSEAKKTKIHLYEYHQWQPMLDSLKSIPGTHLICGHGDNLLPMIDYLGASVGKDKLGHQEYDNLFKVTILDSEVSGEVIEF